MAIPITEEIPLGLTRVDNGETQTATLALTTNKFVGGSICSTAKVFWFYNGGRCHTYGIKKGSGDFSVIVRITDNIRVTQTALYRHHKAVFTPELVEQLTANARDMYAHQTDEELLAAWPADNISGRVHNSPFHNPRTTLCSKNYLPC
jgi:hypothetical protein